MSKTSLFWLQQQATAVRAFACQLVFQTFLPLAHTILILQAFQHTLSTVKWMTPASLLRQVVLISQPNHLGDRKEITFLLRVSIFTALPFRQLSSLALLRDTFVQLKEARVADFQCVHIPLPVNT